MILFEYVTNPTTGTVHLRQATDWAAAPTVCGCEVGRDWTVGLETSTGLRATCRGCGDRMLA